jgi:hypothetical protein
MHSILDACHVANLRGTSKLDWGCAHLSKERPLESPLRDLDGERIEHSHACAQVVARIERVDEDHARGRIVRVEFDPNGKVAVPPGSGGLGDFPFAPAVHPIVVFARTSRPATRTSAASHEARVRKSNFGGLLR